MTHPQVSLLLNADERNFHAWTYRRFLAALQGLTPDAELTYSKTKIDQNFSNYSAWHYRTSLLPKVYDPNRDEDSASLTVLLSQLAHISTAVQAEGEDTAATHCEATTAAVTASTSAAVQGKFAAPSDPSHIPLEVLDEEFELVRQAFFTEPNDQSGWFYHRWLLGAVTGKLKGDGGDEGLRERVTAVLDREAGICSELLEIEPGCKWALLARAQVLSTMDELASEVSTNDSCGIVCPYLVPKNSSASKFHIISLPPGLESAPYGDCVYL